MLCHDVLDAEKKNKEIMIVVEKKVETVWRSEMIPWVGNYVIAVPTELKFTR